MSLQSLLEAGLLGLVEGVTEFLPVSSTGHLILVGSLLGRDDEKAKTFDVVIQLGAILAVVWLYRARFLEILRPEARVHGLLFARNLALAFLPAALIGFAVHGAIKELFEPSTVAVALIAGGVVILVIERMKPATRVATVDAMGPGLALAIGFAQCLALVPGVSRSGATILGGYAMGLSRTAATEFSFFLAVPTMFAAAGYDLYKARGALSLADLPVFLVGFVVAFLSALVVVKALVRFVGGHSFTAFAWYRIALGLVSLWWLAA